jgi:hypothetical protein
MFPPSVDIETSATLGKTLLTCQAHVPKETRLELAEVVNASKSTPNMPDEINNDDKLKEKNAIDHVGTEKQEKATDDASSEANLVALVDSDETQRRKEEEDHTNVTARADMTSTASEGSTEQK